MNASSSHLILLLQRFRQNIRGDQSKIDTHVTFVRLWDLRLRFTQTNIGPTQPLNLDMTPYVSKDAKLDSSYVTCSLLSSLKSN